MRNWYVTGVVALVIIVVAIPLYAVRQVAQGDAGTPAAAPDATFVGREECVDCHTAAYESWLGSHHDDAMDVANAQTVLGDFSDAEFTHNGVTSRFYRRDDKFLVETEGADGELAEFEVRYTFGVEPLQQYLVPFPGGRLQALWIAWDTESKRWFHLYEDEDIPAGDWLHWTRNGQNWNGMCAECHSTNLRKNFDAETGEFNTEWSEIDVSCEACHGPGSIHVEWAQIDPMGRPDLDNYGLTVRTSGLDNVGLVEVCAACHSRRREIGDYDHAQQSTYESVAPILLAEGIYHHDGQILEEDYVWGSFLQSKMYANGVRCDDCHDVHSLALHQQGNALCLQCHLGETYDSYEHHFHQAEVEGEPSDGALCVKCHMPEQVYMGNDWRADHSIRVPRPDLSLEIGTPNSCSQSGCHDDQTVEWAVDAYTKWYGTTRKPHFGSVFAAARAGNPEAEDGLHQIIGNELHPVIVRATALGELRAFPGERTNQALRQALADEEAMIRVAAAETFAGQPPEQLAGFLGPLLFDPVHGVRIAVASQLAGVDRAYLEPHERPALDAALAEHIAANERNLDFAASGMNLGNLYAGQGNLELAEKYYRMALDVDDLFFPAQQNLAVLLSGQGRNDEAEQLLRAVLDEYPEQHDTAYSLALLLVGVGRADEGLEYLGRAAGAMPERARIQYNYGLLLAQMLQDDEAEAALSRALGLEPENLDYLYAMADFLYRRDRLDDALEIADRMIEAHPQQRVGYDIKAAIRNRQQQAP
ncbi:MAG: tetratricopeptide repeat protein [Gammaproteobacteria bacterium]|nr:tetratricopeptide repeat protein [Gammaproteobacteria bacterium]MBT8104790.1 tetratricopeptide repeat protein [Gammaproteobacteria bacterium]NNF50090.1 tetratricopeptide repeat protein [Woeseiaceae bacterium]NNK24804.1 tetratricopeptide repeat protein [Woeseiaceae bacterium]